MNIIDDLLNHMVVVIEEVPSIVIMTDNVIPKNVKEVEEIYQSMLKEGYPLDYLNIEYRTALPALSRQYKFDKVFRELLQHQRFPAHAD